MVGKAVTRRMWKILVFLVLLQFLSTVCSDCEQSWSKCAPGNSLNIADCKRADPCCHFCSTKTGVGCVHETLRTQQCNQDHISYNHKSEAVTIRNNPFTYEYSSATETIQMRPQKVQVYLRLNEPVNVTIEYKPSVKDHPLDLYYLMDLTASMKNDLDTLKSLGENLANTLKNLTKTYRIAFGSYLDKPEMPFYLTDPTNIDNPCKVIDGVCDKGYLFKHHLDFTNNTEDFIKMVQRSKISANVDNLEGGVDGLMQLLLCKDVLGWGEEARKIIILATEGPMHFAGDGLLVGAPTRNSLKECLIDSNGDYVNPTKYDYPSAEELHHQLKKNQTNIIIAAKEHVWDYYDEFNKLIHDFTYLGKLEQNSENILKLVDDGYKKILSRVSFYLHKNIPDVVVVFSADCKNNGYWNTTKACDDINLDGIVRVKVQFTLKKYKPNNYQVDTLNFTEKNVDQKTIIELIYPESQFNCESSLNGSTPDCKNGAAFCGSCVCEESWSGPLCDIQCINELQKCRYVDDSGELSRTCSGRGDCVCGKCICKHPTVGDFCEFECPVSNGEICGGYDHGKCINGTCICNPNYEGEACGCSKSNDNCKSPSETEDLLCSGQGTCECNQCKCIPGFDRKFCENCIDCDKQCTSLRYQECVAKIAKSEKEVVEDDMKCSGAVMVFRDSQEELYEDPECIYRFETDEKTCDYTFTYSFKNNQTHLHIVRKPMCHDVSKFSASFQGGIAVALVLGIGILTLIIWKFLIVRKDRIEYARFQKEIGNQIKSINPLYHNPVVTYHLPSNINLNQE